MVWVMFISLVTFRKIGRDPFKRKNYFQKIVTTARRALIAVSYTSLARTLP